MTRRKVVEQEAAGADSFLDITTNIVGILIILVMVVGERAKTAMLDAPPAEPNKKLIAARSAALSLENDVREIEASMKVVGRELQARSVERNHLSTLIAAVEQEMERRRQELGAKSREQYDAELKLAMARDELKRLEDAREQAEEEAEPETIEIENHPTPIGKTVHTDEVHFRLAQGRVAYVPYEPLMDHLRRTLRDAVSRMQDESEMVDTLGPIEGFRLRYVIQRHNTTQVAYFQLAYVEFMPISSRLGEPVDEALQPASDFHRTLQILSPQRYTITIWTYPDSFAEFRKLKSELYRLGYQVAARPLPEGMPIGASPQGSRSAAE